MNHKDTIKKIQGLVPDVMKLEFGCKVLFKEIKSTLYEPFGRSEHVDTITGIHERINDIRDGHVIVDSCQMVVFQKIGSVEYGEIICNTYKYEILGKPITLAVVLRAILKHNHPDSEEDGLRFNSDIISLTRGHFGFKGWDLSKDDFNEQSEETKDFIGELLK